MRFSLSKLLLVVALAALACGGLMGRTHWWAASIFTLTILIYMASALLSLGRDAAAKIFPLTFAIVGGGYLLIVFSTPLEPIRHSLLTDRLLGVAARALQIPLTASDVAATLPGVRFGAGGGFGGGGFGGGGFGGGGFGAVFDWDYIVGSSTLSLNSGTPASAFYVIGHCVWSWLLAFLSAGFATYAALRYRARKS